MVRRNHSKDFAEGRGQILRDEKGRYLPGVTGNPAGRPRTGLSIRELCRSQVEKRDLIEKLGAIAAGEGEYAKADIDARLRAITTLVQYGYGMPAKSELDAENGKIEVTVTYVNNQLNVASAPQRAGEGLERGATIQLSTGGPPLRKIDAGPSSPDA